MNYNEAVDYIEKSVSRGSILGLSRIEKLCELLGNPQNDYEIIHIAGTNGKGSTSAFISSVLSESGYTTGMYYSPALTGIRDHYRINGELISEEVYAECVTELAKANDSLHNLIGESATSFELETALAFIYFRKKSCRFAVIETGLGGRDDATNVVNNERLCVFTSISYDHMTILGDTLYDIAGVKAGIITNDCPVVAYNSDSEVMRAIREKCSERGNRLSVVSNTDITGEITQDGKILVNYEDFSDIEISLHGVFQKSNAALALASVKALRNIGIDISDEAVCCGMKKAFWPFRFETICQKPLIILDGAHNRDAADKLYDSVIGELDGKKIILVMGMFKDKDYEYVIGKISPIACDVFTLTVPDKSRALDAGIIANVASKYCDRVSSCKNICEAANRAVERAESLEENGDDVCVLVMGSLSYLSIFKESVNGIIYG